jgi:WD40 repeat protein
VDIAEDPEYFLIGDTGGFIRFVSIRSGASAQVIDAFGLRVQSPVSRMLWIETTSTLVCANLGGYVKLWNFNGTTISEKFKFRAHEVGVKGMAISKKFNILITAGQDEQIHLWSIDKPFGFIGRVGRQTEWKLEDRKTWIGDFGLPEGIYDFKKLSDLRKEFGVVVNPEEEDGEEAPDGLHTTLNKSIRSFRLLQPKPLDFSFQHVASMLNGIEEQVERGDRVIKQAFRKTGEIPKSWLVTPRLQSKKTTVSARLWVEKPVGAVQIDASSSVEDIEKLAEVVSAVEQSVVNDDKFVVTEA